MDKALTYLEEVVRELYTKYSSYPVGGNIRYEVFIGEDDTDDDNALDAFNYRMGALNQLKEEGLIVDYVLKDRSEEVAGAEHFSDWMSFKIASCRINEEKLKQHIKQLDQPKVYYDEATGTGEVNGEKFRLKKGSKDELLFTALCENIDKAVPRINILRIISFYRPDEKQPQEHRRKDETYSINEIIKSLRRKTGLTTKMLVNNNGDITLKGLLLVLPQAAPRET